MCAKEPTTRDNYHRGFEYHHVVPRSEGGADSAENAVLLCHDCHGRVHAGNRLTLREPSVRIACFDVRCAPAENDATIVEMNCGWYRCCAATMCFICTTIFNLRTRRTSCDCVGMQLG